MVAKGQGTHVLAHEVAHVLTKEGSHNADPEANLLSLCSQGQRNDHLLTSQCAEILTNPLIFKYK